MEGRRRGREEGEGGWCGVPVIRVMNPKGKQYLGDL